MRADEDLVMYCEDVDLNLRARLHGMRTIYVPQAVVYHRLSATGGKLASYYCGRTHSGVGENMPGGLVRRYWPRFTAAALHLLMHSRDAREEERARLRGQMAFWACALLRVSLRKRPTAYALKRRLSWRQH
ncbi:MAG: hypothetical protein U0074_01090 [Kouleothrix sp.]